MHMNTIEGNDDRAKLRKKKVFAKHRSKVWEQNLTIHSPHPNHPKNVSFSLRKMEDRIAQMTTDRAPSGVCSCS